MIRPEFVKHIIHSVGHGKECFVRIVVVGQRETDQIHKGRLVVVAQERIHSIAERTDIFFYTSAGHAGDECIHLRTGVPDITVCFEKFCICGTVFFGLKEGNITGISQFVIAGEFRDLSAFKEKIRIFILGAGKQFCGKIRRGNRIAHAQVCSHCDFQGLRGCIGLLYFLFQEFNTFFELFSVVAIACLFFNSGLLGEHRCRNKRSEQHQSCKILVPSFSHGPLSVSWFSIYILHIYFTLKAGKIRRLL